MANDAMPPIAPGSEMEREARAAPAIWSNVAAHGSVLARLLPPPKGLGLWVGCGTAWHIGQAVAHRWGERTEMTLVATTPSLLPSRSSTFYDVAYFVSRTGTTTETLKAMSRVRAHRTVAVVTDRTTPIAREADDTLLLDEVKEKAFVQTEFPLAVLALFLTGIGDHSMLNPAPLNPPIDPKDSSVRQIVFVGEGWCAYLADEAALKMREAAGMWAESYPAAEYLHGPLSANQGSDTVMWAIGPVEPRIVTAAHAVGARVVGGTLPPHVELATIYLYAAQLAVARGRNPDHPPFLARSVVF